MGADLFPIEQGQLARPGVPRRVGRFTLCADGAWAMRDERHRVIDCPHFDGLQLGFAKPFDDAHSAMQTLMWDKEQKALLLCWPSVKNPTH